MADEFDWDALQAAYNSGHDDALHRLLTTTVLPGMWLPAWMLIKSHDVYESPSAVLHTLCRFVLAHDDTTVWNNDPSVLFRHPELVEYGIAFLQRAHSRGHSKMGYFLMDSMLTLVARNDNDTGALRELLEALRDAMRECAHEILEFPATPEFVVINETVVQLYTFLLEQGLAPTVRILFRLVGRYIDLPTKARTDSPHMLELIKLYRKHIPTPVLLGFGQAFFDKLNADEVRRKRFGKVLDVLFRQKCADPWLDGGNGLRVVCRYGTPELLRLVLSSPTGAIADTSIIRECPLVLTFESNDAPPKLVTWISKLREDCQTRPEMMEVLLKMFVDGAVYSEAELCDPKTLRLACYRDLPSLVVACFRAGDARVARASAMAAREDDAFTDCIFSRSDRLDALETACALANVRALRALLQYKSVVDVINDEDGQCLAHAVDRAQWDDVVPILIDHGADVRVCDDCLLRKTTALPMETARPDLVHLALLLGSSVGARDNQPIRNVFGRRHYAVDASTARAVLQHMETTQQALLAVNLWYEHRDPATEASVSEPAFLTLFGDADSAADSGMPVHCRRAIEIAEAVWRQDAVALRRALEQFGRDRVSRLLNEDMPGICQSLRFLPYTELAWLTETLIGECGLDWTRYRRYIVTHTFVKVRLGVEWIRWLRSQTSDRVPDRDGPGVPQLISLIMSQGEYPFGMRRIMHDEAMALKLDYLLRDVAAVTAAVSSADGQVKMNDAIRKTVNAVTSNGLRQTGAVLLDALHVLGIVDEAVLSRILFDECLSCMLGPWDEYSESRELLMEMLLQRMPALKQCKASFADALKRILHTSQLTDAGDRFLRFCLKHHLMPTKNLAIQAQELLRAETTWPRRRELLDTIKRLLHGFLKFNPLETGPKLACKWPDAAAVEAPAMSGAGTDVFGDARAEVAPWF